MIVRSSFISVCMVSLSVWRSVSATEPGSLSSMKQEMETLQEELHTLRTETKTWKDAQRLHAGGAPESLRSRQGKATLRIGGELKTQFRARWSDNDPDNPQYRRYSDDWRMETTTLQFQADFTPDTTAFLRLRLDQTHRLAGGHGGHTFIDEAWWQWRNIGNTGINLRVGRFQLPFGEQYNGILPIDSFNDNGAEYAGLGDYSVNNLRNPNMANPANNMAWTPGSVYGVGPEVSLSRGDFTFTLAIADGILNQYGGGSDFTAKNRAQYSAWVNTAAKLEWDPSMIEGLHVSASYLGVHNYGWDNGRLNRQALPRAPQGANYAPSFNLAADYTVGKYRFFFENTISIHAARLLAEDGWAPDNYDVLIYADNLVNTLTAGLTYAHSEKLSFTGMFDWGRISTPKRWYNTPGHGQTNAFRAAFGTQYDFGNGIRLQAAYAHTWSTWSVERNTRNTDELVLQTLLEF